MTVDQEKLEQLMGRVVDELGAALGAGLIVVGERAGLWAAIAGRRPGDLGGAGRAERHR